MTANTDAGATRADTTGNGATSHNAEQSATRHSATGHGVSRAGVDTDDRSWTPPVNTDVRHDRIRWGAVWTGVLTTLSIYIVLQLLFFALGWLDLGFNGAAGTGATAGIVTGVLALIAFFVGGLLAGASTMWRGAGDGLLHGVLVWALSVLGILAIALIGGSALLGPLAQLAGHAAQSGAQPPNVTIDPAQALNAARQSAGATALSLGLAVAAAAIGGTVGSKIWPGKKDKDVTRHDHRVA
jgi:hypothetical protein